MAKKICESLGALICIVAALALSTLAHATSLPTISAAQNPCASNPAGQVIPVWTISGSLCITEAEYSVSPPGAFNIACPNGGAFLSGTWQCNTGSRPMFSQQYLDCFIFGLGSVGQCDPAGLDQALLEDFSGDASTLSALVTAADIVVDHKLGWPTICAAVSLVSSSSESLPTELTTAGFDAACLVSQLFGGNETPPTIELSTPQVSGLNASFNGVMMPTTKGATIPNPAFWSFGDSTTGNYWFPASHAFAKSGTYTVTATAVDSNGLTTTAAIPVTVSSSSYLTPPTIELFTPQVSGLNASFNGVMMPTTKGATIPNPAFWSFGDGTTGNYWFPTSHTFASAGTYTVKVTAADSNGLVAFTSITITLE